MKQKIRRFGKSSLSTVLALLMLISTAIVGTLPTDAAQIADDSQTGAVIDSEAVGANSTIKGIDLIGTQTGGSLADNSFSRTVSLNWGVPSEGTIVYDTENNRNQIDFKFKTNNGTDTYVWVQDDVAVKSVVKNTQYTLTQYGTYNNWGTLISAGGTGSNSTQTYMTFTPTKRYVLFNLTYDKKLTIQETDINPSVYSVIRGDRVMFYYGAIKSWNSTAPRLRTTSNTSNYDVEHQDYTDTSLNVYYSSSSTADIYYLAPCVKPYKYYISNATDWAGVQMGEISVGGKAYILNNSLGSGSGNRVTIGPNRSTIKNLNASYTITQGATSTGIAAALNYSTSVAKKSQSITYYYATSDDYAELTSASVSTLSPGTYTVYAVVSDGEIYVNSGSTTLTVNAVVEDKYSVTVSAGSHGNISGSASTTIQAGATAVTLPTVTVDSGYEFTGWTTSDSTLTLSNADKNNGTATVSATGAGTVTANYQPTTRYFYVTGRFRIYTDVNRTTEKYVGNSGNYYWSKTDSDITFSRAGDYLYRLDTYCTLSELSAQFHNYDQTFFIRVDNENYYTTDAYQNDLENAYGSSNYVTLASAGTSGGNTMVFSGTNESVSAVDLVTLWIDTSGDSMKLYYTCEYQMTLADPDFYIEGRFRTKTAAGAQDKLIEWESTSTSIHFASTATTGLYKLETNCTLLELSEGIDCPTNGWTDAAQNFYVWDKNNNIYYNTDQNRSAMQNANTALNASTLTSCSFDSGSNWMNFTGINAAVSPFAKITLWLDTTDGYGNYKFYYTAENASLFTVYAKNGTVYNDRGSSGNGVTTLTSAVSKTQAMTGYTIYGVSDSQSDIVVRTQVDSTMFSHGMAVLAYSVNGDTYMAEPANNNGAYTATIPLSKYESFVEITPIYYNTIIWENGDYIKVYCDADKVDWGNTLFLDAWYSTGDVDEYGNQVNLRLECDYPGATMFKDGNGKYYSYISKYYYKDGVKDATKPVTGLQINNGGRDQVHGTLYGTQMRQTFDYDDFKWLAEADTDIVQFTIDFGSTRNSGYSMYTKTPHDITNDVDGSGNPRSVIGYGWDGYEWQKLTNYDGDAVDIIGNEADTTKKPLYVVVAGDQEYDDDEVKADHITTWYVFDPGESSSEATFVTYGRPAQFLSRGTQTTQYQLMSTANYVNRPVYISYERLLTDNETTRYDGRWTFTENDVDVTATVQVMEKDANDDFVSNAAAGTATVGGLTEYTAHNRTTQVTLSASAASGYRFEGWYIAETSGTGAVSYKKLDITGSSGQVTLDTNYTFVAVFKELSEGSIVFSHEKYLGEGAEGGLGRYYISAVLTKTDGTTVDVEETEGTAVYESFVPSDFETIEITLKTVCAGANTFVEWYQRIDGVYEAIGPENDVAGQTGTVTYIFTVNVADIYDEDEDILYVSSFNFFSDIMPVSANFEITYRYYDRFDNIKNYIVSGTLDENYLNDYGYSITTDFAYEQAQQTAPAIDDLFKNCVWKITEQSVSSNGTKATVVAKQTEKTYTVTLFNHDGKGDDSVEKVFEDVSYNSYVKENEEFVTAPSYDSAGKKFSFWKIEIEQTDAKTGKATRIEVGKNYARKFNYKITDDYIATAVYGNTEQVKSVTISNPTYSREVYTENGTNYDYLYVDFIVQYMQENVLLLNSTEENYRTGVIVEFDKNEQIKTADDTTSTFAAMSSDIEESVMTSLHNAETPKTTKFTFDTNNDGTDNRTVYTFAINNAKYNNKNRTDYFVKFANKESYRNYIMRAYYYVMKPDGSYEISDPVYFYLMDIGTSDASVPENN